MQILDFNIKKRNSIHDKIKISTIYQARSLLDLESR